MSSSLFTRSVQTPTNSRLHRSPQHVTWTGSDLICEICPHERSQLDLERTRRAVQLLTDAGYVLPASVETNSPSAGLVFRWHDVGRLTYWWEWPAAGWRAAADVALRALDVLKSQGLTMSELQPWDVFMVGSRPMLTNLGALARWAAADEMVTLELIGRHFVRPLECAVQGRAGLARKLLRVGIEGLSVGDAAIVLGHRSRTPAGVRETIAWLEGLTLGDLESRWNNYEDDMDKNGMTEVQAKLSTVATVLGRMKPRSVLDLGCNKGRFSQLAVGAGTTVVGVDNDEECMNTFFSRAAVSNGSVSGLVMDMCDPTPTRGWGPGWCLPAAERLSSECVLMMALIHHLALGARMNPIELRHCLTSLATRCLLMEFVPFGEGTGNPYSWGSEFYTLDWLLDALRPDFVSVERWPYGSRGRMLILFERVESA